MRWLGSPRTLALFVTFIVVAGSSALLVMGRQEDPSITNRIVVLLTPFPGASAARVESLVTEKLEDKMRALEEVQKVTSASRQHLSILTLEIDEGIDDTREALSRIRRAVDDARATMPANLPPTQIDEDRFGAYTMLVALRLREGSPAQRARLKRYGRELEMRFRAIGGTDSVALFGAPSEEVRVDLDPVELNAAGLSVAQVASLLQRADAKVAAGSLEGGGHRLLIEVSGEIDSLRRLREVVLRSPAEGKVLRLGDIARVEAGTQEPPTELAFSEGRSALFVAAQMRQGLRVDRWSEASRRLVQDFRRELPREVELEVVFDQSHYTRTRLDGLLQNLWVGAALVMLVLLFSLGWRSALLVGLTLPLTSLMSLAILRWMKVPIHQMSVTGLVVALGMMVDNAIVVVDSIRERLLRGEKALDALRASVAHLWLPLLSSTLTTVLAFCPILLLPGSAGEFVRTIATSVVVALVSSYLLALTLVAASAGRFLPSRGEASNWWTRGLALPRLRAAFRSSLLWSLAHPKRAIALTFLLPLLGFVLSTRLPQQFFPPADRDQFHIEMRLDTSASLRESEALARRADRLIRRHPEVRALEWTLGRSAPPFYYNLKRDQDGVPSYGQAQVRVRSVEDAQRLMPKLQEELDRALPSAQFLVRELMQGPPVDAPVEVRVFGRRIETLRALGEALRLRMSRVPEIAQSTASASGNQPRLYFDVDEAELRAFGLGGVDLAALLQAHFDGLAAGSLIEAQEELPLRVRIASQARSSVADLADLELPLAAASTQSVALASVGKLELRPSESSIHHWQGERVNSVRAFTRSGVLPDQALRALRRVLDEDPIELPPGYRIEFGGDAEERADALGGLLASLGMLASLMLLIVVLTFNSFRLAASVFTVALQAVGLGLLSLATLAHPMGFQAIIGLLGLIGIAVNAAILINSELQADAQARAGDSERIATLVVERCSRHILSTTITTFGGFLPLLFAGGGLWPPFAAVIAGGVLLSALLSFYFVPPAFLWWNRRAALPPPPLLGEAELHPPLPCT